MKTSVALPAELKNDINLRVVKDGYGLKGKSKWASEAIEVFVELDNFIEYVEIEDLIKFNDKMSFSIANGLEIKIQQSVISVRNKYPALEGVRSKIIRAALLQRLIRGGAIGKREY